MTFNSRYDGDWHVVDTATNKSLESHRTEAQAQRACNIVNEHNATYGHPARYEVQHRGK